MNLGTILRRRRKELGFTLKTVAVQAGVSEGFISQVENNVKSPSVASLMNICRALDVDSGEILTRLENQQRLFAVQKSEWSEVDLPHTGFATRRFCPPPERQVIDSAVLFLEPGSSIPARKGQKNGQEVLAVLAGKIELTHDKQVLVMGPGDAAHFWTEPARQKITNPGKKRAVVLWVGTI